MPTITSTSGTWTHDGSVTVSGSGFGTKATAAPVVWDNCNHGQSLATRWDGGWPSANATYNLDYRVEQRSIAMPHSRTTKYLAGCHYGTGGADAGFNVMGWKNRTLGAFPQFCLMSFRFRGDDGWDFTCGSPCDDNLKHFDYSTGTSPYDPSNWYISKSGEPHPWTPSTGLLVTLPGSNVAGGTVESVFAYIDNGGAQATGRWLVTNGDTKITFQKFDAANWSASTNATRISALCVLPIQSDEK